MNLTTTTQVEMMSVKARTARRLFELLEPICLVTYFADECNEELEHPTGGASHGRHHARGHARGSGTGSVAIRPAEL
jgi:hypothetical protein